MNGEAGCWMLHKQMDRSHSAETEFTSTKRAEGRIRGTKKNNL